ncbi:MAG: LysR family transcriptional regulator [Pseudoxanthomonas sp.]
MSRPLPPLNALRAFEAAARLESISRAASELHVTHGAVSRQVRVLEQELGEPLFVRQGRGLALTPAGARLRDAAGLAFGQLQESWAGLRRNTASAPLVLGCPGSLLARWAIPRLDRLARELPEVKLHFSAQEGEFDGQLRGLDAALLLAEKPWPPEWQVWELAPERIGPVFSPRYSGAAKLMEASLPALLEAELLHTASRRQAWPDWALAQGIDPAALRFQAGFAHLYYLLEAAIAGLGIAIAPQQLVGDDLASGRLLAPWGFTETTGAWILCAPKHSTDPRLPLLAQWLQRDLSPIAALPG